MRVSAARQYIHVDDAAHPCLALMTASAAEFATGTTLCQRRLEYVPARRRKSVPEARR